jgi:hypothetical protein
MLMRDAREIGHAAALELDARVGDVLGLRQHAHADAVDLRDRRLHQREHDADVVDHQVEHDAHLGAARRVGRETLGGDVLRAADLLLEKAHHRVEMLDVADLRRCARPCLRRGQHLFGLLQRGAERLLDQQVAALRQERQRDLRVPVGRHDDRLTASQALPSSSIVAKRWQLCLAQISAARASLVS